MEIVDLAYAAGVVDGEGCIGCCLANGHQQVHVTVAMKPSVVVEWLYQNFGGIKHSGVYTNGEKHTWKLNGAKCLEFLQAIRPYLKLKGPQADLVVLFITKAQGTPLQPLSDAKLLLRERIAQELHSLNSGSLQ